MKTVSQIHELLSDFSKQYNIPNLEHAQQGSAAWFQLKLGVISASNASSAVADKKTQGRATYMAELVAQVCTGEFEELNTKHMEWGKLHEDRARELYNFQNDTIVTELPFVFKDHSFRVGCSPDSLVEDQKKGMEIKCPWNTTNYIQFLTMDKIKPEYDWQANFTMWCLETDRWDMVQYDPRMPKNALKVLTIPRNEEKIKAFEDLIPAFIFDMDKMLSRAGFKFGEQWKRIAEQAKVEAAL